MPAEKKVKIFYCYTSEDEELRDELDKHLKKLKYLHLITDQLSRKILPGADTKQEKDARLNSADIILLLISPDFIASDYCYGEEMRLALNRHWKREASIIPIILRPVDLAGLPIDKLQMLPRNGKPVTKWPNRDEAFNNIAIGVREVVEAFHIPKVKVVHESSASIATNRPSLPAPAVRKPEIVNQKTKEQWEEEGNNFYNEGFYIDALMAYEKTLFIDPYNALIRNAKGNSLYSLERYEEARLAYEQAISLNFLEPIYHGNLGGCLRQLMLNEEALLAYDQSIKLDPNNIARYRDKANFLIILERPDDALFVIDHIIQLRPEDATYYRKKGYVLFRSGHPKQALVAYFLGMQILLKTIAHQIQETLNWKSSP